jgi:lipopolysaccharide transport system ATP-binding protein
MSTVITVENLGKKYLLSHQTQKQPYVALRDVIAERSAAIGRRFLRPFRASNLAPSTAREEFWALKDVSFEIKEGDRVGIIGRNGAGKSTLLKILSRIVEPTTGRAKIRGRVASLLEVGTGFHPELTGRENIFLNGAILGMTRAEIKKKFDEIVDFAEIEKFLDTPVKRYSSGMYVRLAFAVAAHLEPEILLVDEVLAVGDAQFQKKCLGKMEDFSTKEGRTVLFVSHNMAAVTNFCAECILLNQGTLADFGVTDNIVQKYISSTTDNPASSLAKARDRAGDGTVRFVSVSYSDDKMRPIQIAHAGMNLSVVMDYEVMNPCNSSCISFELGIYNLMGALVFLCGNTFSGQQFEKLPPKGKVCCNIPSLPLSPGVYSINIYCGFPGHTMDWIKDAAQLRVVDADFFGTGRTPPNNAGIVWVPHQWTVTESSDSIITQ